MDLSINYENNLGCPKCGFFIEIIDENEEEIKFKCLNLKCDENKKENTIMDLQDYITKIDSIKCQFCESEKDENFKFCTKCNSIMCEECIQNHLDKNLGDCESGEFLIDFNDRGIKCFEHINNNIIGYCHSCNKQLCHECIRSTLHYKHEKTEYEEIKEIINKNEERMENVKNSFEEKKQTIEKNGEKIIEEALKEHKNEKKKIENEYYTKIKELSNEKNVNLQKERNKYNEDLKKLEKEYLENIQKKKNEFSKNKNKINEKYEKDIESQKNDQNKKLKNLKEKWKKQKKELEENVECEKNNINNMMKINEIVQNSVVKNDYNYYDYLNYIKIISLFEEKEKIKENNKIEEKKNNENNLEKTITLNISNLNEDHNILAKRNKDSESNTENDNINQSEIYESKIICETEDKD